MAACLRVAFCVIECPASSAVCLRLCVLGYVRAYEYRKQLSLTYNHGDFVARITSFQIVADLI